MPQLTEIEKLPSGLLLRIENLLAADLRYGRQSRADMRNAGTEESDPVYQEMLGWDNAIEELHDQISKHRRARQ